VLILDKKGNCTYANDSFEQLVGVQDRQALGRGWLRNIVAKDMEKIGRLCMGDGIEICFTCPFVTNWLRLTPTLVKADLYCCTAENITAERKEYTEEKLAIRENADHQKKIMQEILDSTAAILYSVDQHGKITAFNKAANQAIQSRKRVPIQLGDFWPDIVSGDSGLDRDKMTMLLKLVLSGQSYSTIEDVSISKGEKITYSVQASPMLDARGNIIGAVLCAHDITVLVRLQKEAAEKALLRAQELESWNKFYDMLLAVLAHDLRQPLSVIVMNANLVAYSQKALSVDRIKGLMSSLHNTCSKSIELLQGLLYWVKSKKETFSYKPIPLRLFDLIVEANGLFVHDQEKKDLSLKNEVSKDHILHAHHQMMLFVCRNLINNATKYAPHGSEIYVRSILSSKEVTLTVQDNGKGMSEKQLAGLFSIKGKETPDGGIKSAGMALTIAHDMIAQMNGRIWADSELGKGTTFHMAFPVDPSRL
jgi:PAS domain S-box-containing protein